jgi:adenine-specific DNA-methyltransferase
VTFTSRDAAFEDDVARTNMAAILEQHRVAKVRSL